MHSEPDLFTRLLELLKRGSAAAAHEALGKRGSMSPAIRALVDGVLCVGIAYPVRAPAGYGDEIVRAADGAPPGSVIVIDAGADEAACTWGGTGSAIAQRRGVAGVVSSGYVRDIAEIRSARFPVFARGVVTCGWRSGQAGATGEPVEVGGQAVQAGDFICADDDGVVVIPRNGAEAVLARLQARLDFEREAERIVRAGGSYAQVMASKAG